MKMTRTRKTLLFLLLFVCGAIPVATAAAVPVLNGTFTPSGQPGQMAFGPDGNVWFALSGSPDNKEFARIDSDGTITEYDTPNDQAVIGLTAGPSALGGGEDRVWMSQNGSVVKWDPVAGTGDAIPVAALGGARDLVADEPGYIWVVDDTDGLIRLDPGDGSVVDEVPVAGSSGRGISLGEDGKLWWADFGQGSINRTDTAAPFTTTGFPTGGNPQETAAGLDRIGFGDPGTVPQTVGVIDADGVISSAEAAGSDPFGITFALDEAFWTANFASDDLGRLTSEGAYAVGLDMPAGSGPRYLTAGAGGTIWVGLQTSGQVARVTGVEAPSPPDPPGPPDLPGPPGPPDPQMRPKLTKVKVVVKGRKVTLKAKLNRDARVRLSLRKKNGRKFGKARTLSRRGKSGRNRFLVGKRLKRGKYKLTIRATEPDGSKSKRVVRRFRVKPR